MGAAGELFIAHSVGWDYSRKSWIGVKAQGTVLEWYWPLLITNILAFSSSSWARFYLLFQWELNLHSAPQPERPYQLWEPACQLVLNSLLIDPTRLIHIHTVTVFQLVHSTKSLMASSAETSALIIAHDAAVMLAIVPQDDPFAALDMYEIFHD